MAAGGGAWLAGRAVATRTVRAELSEQRAALAEQEAQWRAAAAVAEERLRIAREMHDVISHSVSVMTLHVSGVRRLLRPDQVEERAALEAVERTGRESLAEMHRMLGVLRSAQDGERGPAPGLDRVPELLDAARRAGLHAELTIRGDAAGRCRPASSWPPTGSCRRGHERAAARLRPPASTAPSATATPTSSCSWSTTAAARPPPAQGGHGLAGLGSGRLCTRGRSEAGPRPDGGYALHAVLPVPAAETLPTARDAP